MFNEHYESNESVDDIIFEAMCTIRNLKKPVTLVCGPVLIGGSGSVRQNLDDLNMAVTALRKIGFSVFNHARYIEQLIICTKQKLLEERIEILAKFYRSLLDTKYLDDSRVVNRIVYIDGTEQSLDAIVIKTEVKKFENETNIKIDVGYYSPR